MDPLKTGNIISEARKKLNMTQKDLANRLFVSNNAVSKWERGLCFPDISVLITLSEILNVNLYDLLKGEKMKEEKVEEILKETINYSSKEIKKNKKKTILISAIVVLLISIGFIAFIIYNKSYNEYDTENIKPGDKFNNYNYIYKTQISSIEKEDGWVCKFEIDYYKTNKKNYIYACFNIKYKEVAGFNYYHYDFEKDKYYISDITYPSYIHNNDYYEEVLKINEYFNNKQFDKTISMNELEELKLEKIDKKDVLDLFNKTINSKLIDKYGNYPNAVAKIYNYEYSSYETGNTYVIGYYIDSVGYVRNVYIDLKCGSSYLSDLLKENKVLEDDVELYNQLQEVEKYIVKNQIFDLPNNLKNNKDCKELKKYNFDVVNKLIKHSYGFLGRNYRYVEDLDEMTNQKVQSK